MDSGELWALISLLDDSDKEVTQHVEEKLRSLGTQIIPSLEQAWSAETEPETHRKIEDLIHLIQFESLEKEFEKWALSLDADLITGAYLVSKYHYPEIVLDDIRRKLLRIRQNIWLELNHNQTPLEQIQIFNQIFYYHEGFKGNQSVDFSDFCINYSLDTRKGNTTSLGIIYQCLANDLNLPVYGVTLPKHFILAFTKKTLLDFSYPETLERDIMFYINPINKGSVFSRNEIKDYLSRLNLSSHINYFVPAGNKVIIKELLIQLREAHLLKKEDRRADDMNRLLKIL